MCACGEASFGARAGNAGSPAVPDGSGEGGEAVALPGGAGGKDGARAGTGGEALAGDSGASSSAGGSGGRGAGGGLAGGAGEPAEAGQGGEAPATAGAGGEPPEGGKAGSGCVPTPIAAACYNRVCGPAPDDCGGEYDCGHCSGGLDVCTEHGKCECVPRSFEVACEGACGIVGDGCSPDVYDCGGCGATKYCAESNLCRWLPECDCEALGFECGSVPQPFAGYECPETVTCGDFGGECRNGKTCAINSNAMKCLSL